MSVLYPLAIIDTASITSLVRMTLCHHPIGVYPFKVETSEAVAVLGGKIRSAASEDTVAQLVSNIPGGQSQNSQMVIEAAESK